jgi:hypothetical protein
LQQRKVVQYRPSRIGLVKRDDYAANEMEWELNGDEKRCRNLSIT